MEAVEGFRSTFVGDNTNKGVALFYDTEMDDFGFLSHYRG